MRIRMSLSFFPDSIKGQSHGRAYHIFHVLVKENILRELVYAYSIFVGVKSLSLRRSERAQLKLHWAAPPRELFRKQYPSLFYFSPWGIIRLYATHYVLLVAFGIAGIT